METRTRIVRELCDLITKAELTKQETIHVISLFLYSLGYSMGNYNRELTAEDVAMAYASSPNLSNALMLQAIHMKETWKENLE